MNKPKYLPNLTPMRGIAALLVVVFHLDLMLGGGGNLLLKFEDSRLISNLYLMVDFFFVLSGFIICHVYGHWFTDKLNFQKFRTYTIARFARVYPLHFITLLFTIGVWTLGSMLNVPKAPILQVENHWWSVITNLLLLHSMNIHQWFSWNHASWSISTEWWAYMVFPFILPSIAKFGNWGRFLCFIFIFLGYFLAIRYLSPLVTLPEILSFLKGIPQQKDSLDLSFQFGFVRCLLGFMLGMIAHGAYMAGWAKSLFSKTSIFLILCSTIFLGMHLNVDDYYVVAFFPFIILCGAYKNKKLNIFFGNTLLQKLGNWSFAIYLIHEPLIYLMNVLIAYTKGNDGSLLLDMTEAWVLTIIFIVIILYLASLTYKYIEVPAREKINFWNNEVIE